MIYNDPTLLTRWFNEEDGAHIEFKATAGDNTLHLRTQTAGYDCTIRWGDGTETVAPVNGGNVIHNYAAAGAYHIYIVGRSFAGFWINYQTGKEKYTAAHSMGRWEADTASDFSRCFYGCTKLTTISADLFRYNTNARDFGDCFYYCDGIKDIPENLFRYNTAATGFGNCFERCRSLTTLPADLFRYNTKASGFDGCFSGCYGLTSIPADLFRYNTAAMYFGSCFSSCGELTTLPTDLFRYNTNARRFSNCFSGCGGLTTLPPNLFRYNTGALDFDECFYDCTKLTLRSDVFGTDPYSFDFYDVYLNRCFYRSSFSGTKGTAPELWNFTFPYVEFSECFGGAGNSAASLSNYADIPAEWK